MSKKRIAFVCGKICEAPEGDYFVTCSFDPNHVILRSRMPYHIIKCVKQHPGHNKIQCPYDATEYIDKDEFEDHVLNCESRRSVVDDKFETAKLKASGRMCNLQQTPFFHEHGPKPDEEWGGSTALEVDDFNEDLFDNIRPVGRGIRNRNQNQKPKKGMGRAEMLRRIFESHNKRQPSLSSSSSTLSNTDRLDISEGQFEDK